MARSVFTTQSATAVLEHIRDQIKAAAPDLAMFLLGPSALASSLTRRWTPRVHRHGLAVMLTAAV